MGEDYVIKMIKTLCDMYGTEIAKMPDKAQVFMDVTYFKGCFDDGGLDGFLNNPAGDRALETLAALDKIGAKQTRTLLERACSVYPGGLVPREIEQRQRLVDGDDGVWTLWDEIEQAIAADPDDIDALVITWLEQHKQDFPSVGEAS